MATTVKRRGIRATRFLSDTATPSIVDVLQNDLSRAAGREIVVELDAIAERVSM